MASIGTNAPIILTIFAFYAFIIVIFGLIGSSQLQTNSALGTVPQPSTVTFLGQISLFIQGIFFTISTIPVWANAIIFTPISYTLFYVVLTYFRGGG